MKDAPVTQEIEVVEPRTYTQWLVIEEGSNFCVNAVVGDENTPAAYVDSGYFLVNKAGCNPAGAWIGWLYDPATETFSLPE